MSLNSYNLKLWIYRCLVFTAAGLMLASFIMPWWTAHVFSSTPVIELEDGIRIYGHGLEYELAELDNFILSDKTPYYQTVLAWIYISVSVGLVLISAFLKGMKGRLLLGGVGLIYIVYVMVAVFVVISNRLNELGFVMEGYNYLPGLPAGAAGINSSLRFGYYLSYIAGGMCVALALFSGIAGKSCLLRKRREKQKEGDFAPS